MTELENQFKTAAGQAKELAHRPDNDSLLKLYALYKQATTGDVAGKRPGMLDMVGRAKYDAWATLKGTSKSKAMQAYIALVELLQEAD